MNVYEVATALSDRGFHVAGVTISGVENGSDIVQISPLVSVHVSRAGTYCVHRVIPKRNDRAAKWPTRHSLCPVELDLREAFGYVAPARFV